MTAKNPAIFLQSESHPAEDVRRLFSYLFAQREGILTPGSLLVSEAGSPNLSVDVAEGALVIAGTEATFQGHYFAENRGVTNLAVSAGDVTNQRYDLVVATVEDTGYGGATSEWRLEIVEGTPAATPLFPTVPANGFVLAVILVPVSASQIVDADITDIRDSSDSDGTTTLINRGRASTVGGLIVVSSESNRPLVADVEVGQEIYEVDSGRGYRLGPGDVWQQINEDGESIWFTYTPSTLGNFTYSSSTAKFSVKGKSVSVLFHGVLDAVPTGDFELGLFHTAASDWRGLVGIADASAVDTNATSRFAGAVGIEAAGTSIKIYERGGSVGATSTTVFNATVPFTWASGDTITLYFEYELV